MRASVAQRLRRLAEGRTVGQPAIVTRVVYRHMKRVYKAASAGRLPPRAPWERSVGRLPPASLPESPTGDAQRGA